jgi:Protein of unknown function (DUF3300)
VLGSGSVRRKLKVKRLFIGTSVAVAFVWLAAEVPHGSPVQSQTGQKPAASSAAPSSETLDRLLAPIALYPDQLLAQILLCAANPGKFAALQEWMASHQGVKGTELQDAAMKSGFETSFVALVLFPDVVAAMAGNMEWTTQVGQAFAADRSSVFDSIQRLRAKAKTAGTLKTTPQQEVETRTTSSGGSVIVIEPTNPQVVYVPQYNPTTVYTQPTTSTVVVKEESSSSDAVAAGLIGFTAGIAIGAAIDNDYYYGPYGWHGGGAYMYNDAWDDWYDEREDAREDWQDHREDLADERGERAENAGEQRTERAETRQENRPETQAQRAERQQTRQQNHPEAQAAAEQRRAEGQSATGQTRSTPTASQESRGYSRGSGQTTTTQRSGTKSDAFSGYSSGKSERAASSRGQSSRSSSRGGGRRR